MAVGNPREEAVVRKIIKSVYDQVGQNTDIEKVKKIVIEALSEISSKNPDIDIPEAVDLPDSIPMGSTRVIITAFGINQPGVVAQITECLAENSCDILDISQKILQEFFALILIVDIGNCKTNLRELKDCLGEIGNKLGIRVLAQHEDVFNYQHRI